MRNGIDSRPTCIDLFAGAGGLAEGFRQAGWRILAGVDNDPSAAATFQQNFPEAVFFLDDISALSPATLLEKCSLERGQLDCLIGGPPCQSFSYNNHARSASNHRARLFRQYLRIVATLQPKTLVMENVPGMLTIGNGTIVKEIERKLATLGYESCTKILFAEDFGVPQKRRRAFVIATMLGWESLIFPRGTHGPSPKPSEKANSYIYRWKPRNGKVPQQQVTVWNAISDLPPVNGSGGEEVIPYRRKPRTDFQKEIRRGSDLIHNHRGHQLTPPMIRRIRSVPEGGNWRDIPRQLLPAGMKRARKSDHTKRYGRLARKGLSSTILTKCDPHWGSYVHPLEDRTITVREAARLQTFPDRFRFSNSLSKQYELVGNAVPPLLAKQIARSLSRHIARKSRPKLPATPAVIRRTRS